MIFVMCHDHPTTTLISCAVYSETAPIGVPIGD